MIYVIGQMGKRAVFYLPADGARYCGRTSYSLRNQLPKIVS